MTAQKILNQPREEAACPIPCRYLQLPTAIVGLFKQYFAIPATDESRWLPSVAHLQYFDEQLAISSPTTHKNPTEEQFANQIEIGRVEEYPGDRHTDLPKILVRRGGVLKTNNAISDQHRQSPNSFGRQVYSHIYTLSVITFAFSRDPGQSEHIAAECEQLLSHFSPVIRRKLNLQKFRVNQLGDIGRIKEFPGFFATPVVVDIQFEDNVQLVDGNMPVRYLNLNLTF